uniref:Spindle assembly abnormal protein 6 N-terminal domain-containing protein n=1 Tax=Anopheles atroparvus TaxID=41427 RepID=A0AAG5CNA3_ANOAO
MDTSFVNSHLRRSVKVLFPIVPLQVYVENTGIGTQRMFRIIVEKMDMQNLVQIRLTEEMDHSRMFISTIDNAGYERIRVEQSLHVTFQGFIDHLIKILDSCKRNELHLALINENDGQKLQIFEKSSFKNLTHLFLEMEKASTEAVLFHINQTLQVLQEQRIAHSAQIHQYSHEIDNKNDMIDKLKSDMRALNEKVVEQENLIFNRNTEEISRLHQTIKHLTEGKDLEEKRYKAVINGMQEKIDQITVRMAHEAKRLETIREENIALRSQNTQLREETDRMKVDLSAHKNREYRADASLIELKRHLCELQGKMKTIEKQRSELEAELEAEKNICQTKKHALQLTTDELAHASSVINNLNKENMKLKSKIDLRTEIAMRQEKMLQEKEKKLMELSNTIAAIQQEHIRNRTTNEEYAQTVKRIKETTDVIEEKYRRKINDMILKISGNQHTEAVSVLGHHNKQEE